MKRSSRNSGNSLQIAFIFVCCIALLFAGGMLLKLFLVLRASTFDGMHQYIVEVTGNTDKGALLAFNPQSKSVSMLIVNGKVDTTYARYLDMPSDALVSIPILQNVSKLTENTLFHSTKEKYMTIVDKLRLLIFVNTLKPSDFHYEVVTLPIDDKTKEKLLSSLFFDQALYNENESATVVNATGEVGLGSKVAHMLTTIGINVVSVTTADKDQEKSVLAASKDDTYTVKRIGRLFHLDAHRVDDQTISDITLTLGKDSLSQLQ